MDLNIPLYIGLKTIYVMICELEIEPLKLLPEALAIRTKISFLIGRSVINYAP